VTQKWTQRSDSRAVWNIGCLSLDITKRATKWNLQLVPVFRRGRRTLRSAGILRHIGMCAGAAEKYRTLPSWLPIRSRCGTFKTRICIRWPIWRLMPLVTALVRVVTLRSPRFVHVQ
jgi:hypothetical protein